MVGDRYWTLDAWARESDTSITQKGTVEEANPGDRVFVWTKAALAPNEWSQALQINTQRGFFVTWCTSLLDSTIDIGSEMMILLNVGDFAFADGAEIAHWVSNGGVIQAQFHQGSGSIRARCHVATTKPGMISVSVL